MKKLKFGTLSSDGARLLRAARDQIACHPDQFHMRNWDCGTTACIAGWVRRVGHIQMRDPLVWCGTQYVAEALGFRGAIELGSLHPLEPLFYNVAIQGDIDRAIASIDAFLWQYGYPPEELAQKAVAEPVNVCVQS